MYEKDFRIFSDSDCQHFSLASALNKTRSSENFIKPEILRNFLAFDGLKLLMHLRVNFQRDE